MFVNWDHNSSHIVRWTCLPCSRVNTTTPPPPTLYSKMLQCTTVRHGCKVIDGLIDTDDVKDIIEMSRTIEVEKQVAKKLAELKAKSSGPRFLKVKWQDDYSQAEASEYIPRGVPGCRITKDEACHQTWQVFYPTDSSPFSRCRVWNRKRSSKQALFECLEWVWQVHNTPCPYDLQSILAEK